MPFWSGEHTDDYKKAVHHFHIEITSAKARWQNAVAQNEDEATISDLEKAGDELQEKFLNEMVEYSFALPTFALPIHHEIDPKLWFAKFKLLDQRIHESEDPNHQLLVRLKREGQKEKEEARAAEEAKDNTTDAGEVTEQMNPGTP